MDPTLDPTLVDDRGSGDPGLVALPVSRERREGDVLDRRYRLSCRLGRGGFGDVWRADELLPDGAPFREVALKVLTADFADAAHWTEEAKLLASLRHPSLVTVYSAGLLAGPPETPFVAMELLEGGTLADLLRQRGRIPWRRVLAWARDVAGALDAIHTRGVVHLDLKPANLFLTADGAVKVLDFGISRRAGGAWGAPAVRRGESTGPLAYAATRSADDVLEGGRTVRGVVGTPGFIAPEVLDMDEPAAATDAYALAVCIAQLTTGRLPQAAPDEPEDWANPTVVSAWWAELKAATLHGDLRDLGEDEAQLPRGLLVLLKRLLDVDPAARGVPAGGLRPLLDDVWERPYGVLEPPYFGLAPLPAQAEGHLFGRDDDIARLGRELEFEGCVILQGARGAGKTSLAQAGLVPYLGRRHIDGKDDWVGVPLRPGDAPDEVLSAALARIAPELEGVDLAGLLRWCEAAPVGLALVVDPLEEISAFPDDLPAADDTSINSKPSSQADPPADLPAPSLDNDAAMRDTLLDLAGAVGRRPHLSEIVSRSAQGATLPGLRVIGVLGEERAASLLATPMGASLRGALRYVGPPGAAAVKDIVAGPARLAGAQVRDIEPVAAEVQRELRGAGEVLPFVALALAAWWASREQGREGTVLRGDAWRAQGGVRSAMARHADQALAALDPATKAVADEVLLRLGTMDDTPVRWAEDELADAIASDAIAGVLAALESARLLRRRAGHVEVAHAALLSSWPHLRTLRALHMQRLILLERLREAGDAWERSGNHRDFLLRGDLLQQAATDLKGMQGLPRRERELLRESRRRARWKLAGKIGAGVGVAVLIGGSLTAQRMVEAQQAATNAARRAAELRADLAEIIGKSRRTEDPFHRTAWVVEAMTRGGGDPMLPLDLVLAASSVPRAYFLTLDPISAPALPWDDRWIIGGGQGGTLFIADLKPRNGGVIEGLDIDADLEDPSAAAFLTPHVTVIRPHATPLAERVPFGFDTALATRSVTGEVRVFRLRDNGEIALAATAPMRCTGALHAAQAAPVLSCTTDAGIARWDLRRGGAVDRHAFKGSVLDVSPDGVRVAAAEGRRVLLWEPSPPEGVPSEETVQLASPVMIGRWSPRDRAIALVQGSGTTIQGLDGLAPPLLELSTAPAPASARWDPGGLDLGVCSANGVGAWHYLRRGGRAPSDPPPRGSPCAPGPSIPDALDAPDAGAHHRQRAEPLRSDRDAGELGDLSLGQRTLAGGWLLPDGRALSRDMVLFGPGGPAARRLLRFEGREPIWQALDDSANGHRQRASTVAVIRDEDVIAWQSGEDVLLYDARDGQPIIARPGNLLRRCDDGRIFAYRLAETAGPERFAGHGSASAGPYWEIFDVSTDATFAAIPRTPAFVIGLDAACATLFTQELDGNLVATPLGERVGEDPETIAVTDGYIYDVRPSAVPGEGSGLLLAFSSGAVARIDDATRTVRLLGYATPFATAIADVPRRGEVAYADAGGVVIVRRSGVSERVLEGAGAVAWEDIAPSPDGRTLLLSSVDRLAVLDLGRRELIGSILSDGRERLSPWDDEGSVLAWTFGRTGPAEGLVVPRGLTLAQQVAAAVSNLEVKKKRLVAR